MPLYPSIPALRYFKLVTRSFVRNRHYALLNLLGLSIGFVILNLAAIYVFSETHFENFHRQSDKIYRATYQFTQDGDYSVHWARIPFTYINELPSEVAGIKHLIRFQNHERKYLRVGEEKFRPNHAYVTDKEVFDVFDFHLIAGDKSTALAKPHSVVICRSLAEKYFPGKDPIGRDIYVIGDLDKTETLHSITGVMEDTPENTHLPVEMLISFENQEERSGWAYTYILLEEGVDIDRIEKEIPAFIRRHSAAAEEAGKDAIIFQPLHDIHLHSDIAREIIPGGNSFYVQMAGFAGLFILILAVINFTNLNSAMALGRAKEMGMRKVMGASRRELAGYLFMESVIHNILAAVVGGGITYFAFPVFRSMIPVEFFLDPAWFAAGILALAVVTGVTAGIYPVLLLTAVKPMDVMKTSKALSFAGKESQFSFKRIMVTVQFGITILLLGSAAIAYDQLRFISNRNLGIEREQIIAIPGVPDPVKEGFETFRERLSSAPGILGVSACMEVPSREIRDAGPVLVEGINADPSKAPVMDIQVIDHQFAGLLKLDFLAGTNIPSPSTAPTNPEFTEEFTIQNYLMNKPRHYLINETAMRQLGWQTPEDAVGQRISWSIGDMVLDYGPISGVVRDFHQETLKNKVDPVIMVEEPVWLRTFLIKVETDDVSESMTQIQSTWDDLFPFYPMEYYFLDDLYENLYKGERMQLRLLFILSGVAILIAFIGLVALVSYALKTRGKEIAVRKVLGATLNDLVRMMGREYLIVLLVGSLIAIPLSIYGVNQWLAGFAYRVGISPATYVITVLAVMLLVLMTIGWQTIRSSKMNVSQALREE